jgi:hypothetical protein
MWQLWILPAHTAPHIAVRDGSDRSVCGDCIHRPTNAGTCYVKTFQAPLSVWSAHKRGRYGELRKAPRKGCVVRIGAWGDPGALPVGTLERLWSLGYEVGTGYTHRWRQRPDLRSTCMASCDSVGDADLARSLGWRTARIGAAAERRDASDPLAMLIPDPREVACPAIATSGVVTCDRCRICDGGARDRTKNVVFAPHGASKRRLAIIS